MEAAYMYVEKNTCVMYVLVSICLKILCTNYILLYCYTNVPTITLLQQFYVMFI